jgi:hypothetical protein
MSEIGYKISAILTVMKCLGPQNRSMRQRLELHRSCGSGSWVLNYVKPDTGDYATAESHFGAIRQHLH